MDYNNQGIGLVRAGLVAKDCTSLPAACVVFGTILVEGWLGVCTGNPFITEMGTVIINDVIK